jgi:O-6-methylguanine DNA methyltransferase
MIEVYAQSHGDSWFAVALVNQQIVSSSIAAEQKAVLNNVLTCMPFNEAFQVFHEPTAFAKTALSTLQDIYEGKETNTELPLLTSCLPVYTRKVLKATAQIPVGYVTSYGAIANAVGGGPRAVGNVMANNPFMPLVPCHRVVKSDFGLGGYGGGISVKIKLLGREKRGFSETKEVNLGDACLKVYPVEYVIRHLA